MLPAECWMLRNQIHHVGIENCYAAARAVLVEQHFFSCDLCHAC